MKAPIFQELALNVNSVGAFKFSVANDGLVKQNISQLIPNKGIKISNVTNDDTKKIWEIDCGDFTLTYEVSIEIQGFNYIIKDIKSIP